MISPSNEGFESPSSEQRGLYWVWVTEIAIVLEMDKNEIHESFKSLYNGGKSTMNLHKIQFTDYMQKVYDFGLLYGIELTKERKL